MGLVDYSDSDNSDTESVPTSAPALKSSGKPAFQKVVDRSNPGKIRVSLPQTVTSNTSKGDEPPAKRAKIGGGGLGGFNSFLPAPKKTGVSGVAATLGGGNAGAKRGLGTGVNLKTGAAPGFRREPEPEREYEVEEPEDSLARGSGLTLPTPKGASTDGEQKPAEEVKLVGKPLMFKPLSVARNPANKKKKKPVIAQTSTSTSTPASSVPATPPPKVDSKPAPRPKVSLFSMNTESAITPATNSDTYEPLIYTPMSTDEANDDSSFPTPSYSDYTPTTHSIIPPAVPTPPVESLSSIAGDLNLSAAERRQLFGRQRNGHGAVTKVINFNTDQEYLHNEAVRASGETVVHNPVRAIAPGKHSLKQLVTAAQTQKDALEESFAKGKNNRAEASSRYGW